MIRTPPKSKDSNDSDSILLKQVVPCLPRKVFYRLVQRDSGSRGVVGKSLSFLLAHFGPRMNR